MALDLVNTAATIKHTLTVGRDVQHRDKIEQRS